MKNIALGGIKGEGKFTLVDDEDFKRLNKHKWNIRSDKKGQEYIRTRSEVKIMSTIWGIFALLILVVGIVLGFMFGVPAYNVWNAGMTGRATLNQADYERQVQIINAKANQQAQQYNADSEVIRAGGVAKANNIIKSSITQAYIEYLWVQTLDSTKNQIIYVPEGADGLPLTEAGRATASK